MFDALFHSVYICTNNSKYNANPATKGGGGVAWNFITSPFAILTLICIGSVIVEYFTDKGRCLYSSTKLTNPPLLSLIYLVKIIWSNSNISFRLCLIKDYIGVIKLIKYL